jgi:hypothetical protein
MKKLLIGIVVFVMLSFSAVAFPISSIRLHNEYLNLGDEFEMYVNLVNELDNDLEDLNFRVFLMDFGGVIGSNKFDIADNDKRTESIFWDIPKNLPRGEYLIKITVKNKNIRDVKYRYITFV